MCVLFCCVKETISSGARLYIVYTLEQKLNFVQVAHDWLSGSPLLLWAFISPLSIWRDGMRNWKLAAKQPASTSVFVVPELA